MTVREPKARSRALVREWEAKNGLLNLYKEDFAEEAARRRADYERAGTVLRALHTRLGNHRRHAAGLPPLDEATLSAFLAESAEQLPLHDSPAVVTAERALGALPEADAFADVAVMLVSTPNLSATAIAEEGAQAICVSWTLLQTLEYGNGVLARFRPGGISPTVLAQELRALRPFLTLDRSRMPSFHPDQFKIEPVVLQVLQTLFLVFHEAGHIVLRHLSGPPSLEGEIAADDFAFRALRHIATHHAEIFEDLVPANAIGSFLQRAVFNFFAISLFLRPRDAVAASHPDPVDRLDHFTGIFGLTQKDRAGARLNLQGLKLLAEFAPTS